MEPICFLNGAIIPLKEANISVLDLSVVRGFGIYEGITAIGGKLFRFDDHWDRFVNSAQTLGLTIPYTKEEVQDAMQKLVAHNAPGARASLRMILTGGESKNGLEHTPGNETLLITAGIVTPLPSELYERGGHLIRHDHQRFVPEIKTINYITAVTLQKKRADAGAIEILYTNNGRVLECATSNIFMVKNGVVCTPSTDILPGITRKVTLEIARAHYPVEERSISTDEFFNADEAFLTSSFKDIVPIVSVDSFTIGTGIPGSITKNLIQRFAEYAHT